MSKNPKPTTEELEFIYDLIQNGFDDESIINEYLRRENNLTITFPIRTDKRFIKERRKELTAARRVLQEHVKKKIDPITTKRKEEHFNHLAEISGKIWTLNMNIAPGDESDEYDYLIGEYNSAQKVTTEELCSMLTKNFEQAYDQYGLYDVECFETHLLVEFHGTKAKGLSIYIKEKPCELIETLMLLTQRKTFKGTCPVCKDW